jgi:ubiquinone/menaquinone biosynthesis C-methylase UbiE
LFPNLLHLSESNLALFPRLRSSGTAIDRSGGIEYFRIIIPALRYGVDCAGSPPFAGTREEGMEDFYPSTVKMWNGWDLDAVPSARELTSMANLAGPHHPAEFAHHLYLREALHSARTFAEEPESTAPYTLQWFLEIETKRHQRHGRWIPRLLEFAKHSGETLLGLGDGLGTDWLQYARHGAKVVVCCPAAEELELVQRNFELRGLSGRFLHVPPTCLPLPNCSIDVACISGLLDRAADPRPIVEEVYRVLKPGGKVLAVAPATYDVDFWSGLIMPWQRWLASGTATPVSYSRRRLRLLFQRFSEHRVHKRHLRRRETPHLWRWVPLSLLERFMGRSLVLKAFKPLSTAAVHSQRAA